MRAELCVNRPAAVEVDTTPPADHQDFENLVMRGADWIRRKLAKRRSKSASSSIIGQDDPPGIRAVPF
ncbi:MAG TPA: hypothetical protein VGB24_23885 [Longimicrobium sp.]|jgi:predicted metal-dependent hydrolase